MFSVTCYCKTYWKEEWNEGMKEKQSATTDDE